MEELLPSVTFSACGEFFREMLNGGSVPAGLLYLRDSWLEKAKLGFSLLTSSHLFFHQSRRMGKAGKGAVVVRYGMIQYGREFLLRWGKMLYGMAILH